LQRHYYYINEKRKNKKINTSADSIQQKDQEITNLNQTVQQKDQEVSNLSQVVQQKEQEITHLGKTVQQKNQEIQFMQSSKFWKLRERHIKIKGLKLQYIIDLSKKGLLILRRDGVFVFIKYIYKYLIHGREYFQSKPRPEKPKTDYERWIEKNEKWDKNQIRSEIKNFKYKPKISIVTPVYNVDPKWLDKCIQSVAGQFYENWELCLHDDASTNEETVKCLRKWEKADLRIKISYGKNNQHISGASNEALKMATGEFVALLDNDDELLLNALYENVKLLNKHPEADFIYSDEDKLEMDGIRTDPFFKPDWSPDLFLSMMYTCHLGVYRKKIIDEIEGFRKGLEGSQDYDLVLRFIEETKSENIFHISKILYHWRKIPGSTADKPDAKNYAYVAAKKALSEYLDRNNIKGEVIDGKFIGAYRVKREIIGNPLVSIIISFRDQVDVLKACIKSIKEKTDYKNYELILVDNQSMEKKSLDYIESLKGDDDVRVLQYNKLFNFSAINNFATKHVSGEYLLFLNNDIEAISDGWLTAMVEQLENPAVGVVGAKLLYLDNTIQHAGVVMGLGIAGHAFRGLRRDDTGYFGLPMVMRNYSAVTGACLLTKKKIFEEVGGFDEVNSAIAHNDVDLCLRIREAGYLVVYTPYAELYHHESLSRDNDAELKYSNPEKYKLVIAEQEHMRKKWNYVIENDPYYNVNLTRKSENFGLKID